MPGRRATSWSGREIAGRLEETIDDSIAFSSRVLVPEFPRHPLTLSTRPGCFPTLRRKSKGKEKDPVRQFQY